MDSWIGFQWVELGDTYEVTGKESDTLWMYARTRNGEVQGGGRITTAGLMERHANELEATPPSAAEGTGAADVEPSAFAQAVQGNNDLAVAMYEAAVMTREAELMHQRVDELEAENMRLRDALERIAITADRVEQVSKVWVYGKPLHEQMQEYAAKVLAAQATEPTAEGALQQAQRERDAALAAVNKVESVLYTIGQRLPMTDSYKDINANRIELRHMAQDYFEKQHEAKEASAQQATGQPAGEGIVTEMSDDDIAAILSKRTPRQETYSREYVEQLQAALQQAQRERDAALADARRNLEWAYALMVELAVVCLEETNRTVEPGEWPAGQEWGDLVGTSRSVFMHKARERAGISHELWRDVILSEVNDRMVDIWERKVASAQQAAQPAGEG